MAVAASLSWGGEEQAAQRKTRLILKTEATVRDMGTRGLSAELSALPHQAAWRFIPLTNHSPKAFQGTAASLHRYPFVPVRSMATGTPLAKEGGARPSTSSDQHQLGDAITPSIV